MTQEEALAILNTGVNTFLTGYAGTGKSWLTQEFIRQSREAGKTVIVTAPTGIAAINVGGATIHSTFKMFGYYNLFRKPKMQSVNWMYVDTIIIDEVSMVGPDYLDYIDFLLQMERGCEKPFGGIQMVLVGDPNQLPPVYAAKTDLDQFAINELIAKYKELKFQNAHSFQGFEICELTEVKRQKDPTFVNLLNEIRAGNMTAINSFNKGYGDKNTVHLKPYNTMVDKYNNGKLNALKSESKTYTGRITGDFKASDSITPIELELKVGARIMVTANLGEEGLVNGDLGTVKEMNDDGVLIHSDRFDTDFLIVEKEFKKIEYEGHTERTVGTFTQIPLKLSWAMSIHKSQGLTLDSVALTLVKGMTKELVYVGLSRATDFNRLYVNLAGKD